MTEKRDLEVPRSGGREGSRAGGCPGRRVSTGGGALGTPGFPGPLVDQPLGQFAAPASASEASAMAESSRYPYLLSLERAFTGLPSFRPVVAANVTGYLHFWQCPSEQPTAHRASARGSTSPDGRTIHSASHRGDP